MNSLLQGIVSLLAAGTMMVSAPLDAAAPQHDMNGLLFLANREWRVHEEYIPAGMRESQVPGQVRRLRDDAAAALEEMFAAAKEEKITLTSVSGYRSYDKQMSIYKNKLEKVGSKSRADEYVARPGASEHQLAMAMDVGQKNKVNLNAGFGSTKGGKWVRENCWKFGFIIRYDEGWEEITGYEYEPWHVRYVGKKLAKTIHEMNVPLETYLLLLREETLLAIIGKD